MGFWGRPGGGRRVPLLGQVAGWLQLFRGINRFYQELSMDQLRSEMRRTAPPEQAPEGGDGKAPSHDAGDSERP